MNLLTPEMIWRAIACVRNILSIGNQKKECIIAALKLQLPMPPLKAKSGIFVLCGNCKNHITNIYNFRDVKNCPYCGQKIDKIAFELMEVDDD